MARRRDDDKEFIYDSPEREWRRYLVEKVDGIEEKLSVNMAWTLVFRVVGGGLVATGFAMLVAYIEFRLGTKH
jgi:hypothetical protein